LEERIRGFRYSRSPQIKKSVLHPKRRNVTPVAPLVKGKKMEGHSSLEEATTLTSRLISPSLKVNWTRIFF